MFSSKDFFMKKALNIILTILLGIAIFVFIITLSIGLPIYCRWFYYMQIEPLNIPQNTGFTVEQIKLSYNQVLDYLVLPNATFGTGAFKHSVEGASHFADCKGLFLLNGYALIISFVVMLTLIILNKFKVIELLKPFGMSVAFISSISIFVIAFILGILVSIDLDTAFTIFHHLFFPGKDNWQFSSKDEIIYALPQQFFMNCAILIGASIIIICVAIIVFQLIKKHKNAKKDDINEQN
jgi:integral membrane protein (TIGR01906 family)